MDDKNDFWESIRYWLTERFASPFLGPYIFSWLVWNFRIILIVFGSGELPLKLSLITSYLEPMWGDQPWYIFGGQYRYVFLGPLVTTLFYILIYPFAIALPAYKLRLVADRAFKSARIKGDKLTTMTVDEGNRLRVELDRQESRHQGERTRDAEVISSYRARVESLEVELAKVSKPDQPKDVQSESVQISKEPILELISMGIAAEGFPTAASVTLDIFIRKINIEIPEVTQIRIRSIIDSLLSKNLIARSSMNDYLTITAAGRKYIVENNLDNPSVVAGLVETYRSSEKQMRT